MDNSVGRSSFIHKLLATGSHERPIVFQNNDCPGIMLASAIAGYLNRYGVRAGSSIALFTTNDSVYPLAKQLAESGGVVAVIDARAQLSAAAQDALEAGINVLAGSVVADTSGDDHGELTAITVAAHHEDGTLGHTQQLEIDALANGTQAGVTAAAAVGYDSTANAPRATSTPQGPIAPLRMVASPDGGDAEAYVNHFVDLHRDQTVADVLRATGAGMSSVEHIKRYTSISTGNDQGKTGAVNAIGVMSELLDGHTMDDIGTTTFRAPYSPVSYVGLAGRQRGKLFDPLRKTPMDRAHVELGAVFEMA